jgi:hypothetical protein
MPQIQNSVSSLIISQTPSEYIHKNYDLTRLIVDYQHIKLLSSETQPSHTFVRRLCKARLSSNNSTSTRVLMLQQKCHQLQNVLSGSMFSDYED